MLKIALLARLLAVVASQVVLIKLEDTGCDVDPPFPQNGRFKLVEFKDEFTTACLEYSCDIGYDLEGERYNFCRNGSWTFETAPACVSIRCPPPPFPENGIATPRVPFTTSPVSYACNPPFLLEGIRFNYCRNGVWWRTEPPRCVLRNPFDVCRHIRCVHNAVCSEGVCRCRRGYSGHGRRRCDRMCEEVPKQPNAVPSPLREAYDHKTTIEYACADGYKLVDRTKTLLRCYFGTFRQVSIREIPSCNESLCRDPQTPESGGTLPANDVTVTWNDGDVVEYFCNPGYRLVGQRRVVCREPDSFAEVPFCVDTCLPDSFPNSDFFPLQVIYNPGDTIVYRCDRGYQPLSGFNPIKTCEGGFFVGDSPDCELVCDPPEAPENGRLAFNQSVWFVGDVVRYRCNPGFELMGEESTVCMNATSFAVTPLCERPLITCMAPVPPTNGAIQPADRTTWVSGDVVTYSCNENFTLIGDTTSMCRLDGEFEMVTLRCVVVCIPPVPPPDGVITPVNQSQWIEEDSVTYSCNAGFRLVGSETVTCSTRTSFLNVTSCMAIPCDPPMTPENGSIEGNQTSWVSGDVAVYSCMDNFTLIGADNTTCRDDGMFDDVNVTCAVVCIPPLSPLDGAISPVNQSEWIEGDMVTYTCNAGFRLVGNENVTCSIRNSFVNVTSCIAIPCDLPIPPENGLIEGNQTSWVSGDVAVFSCMDNFTLIGADNTTCRDDGMFDDVNVTCAVICIAPVLPLNGAITPANQSQWIEDDVVTYVCDDGFLLVGTEEVTCSNRTSFEKTPSCLAICDPPMPPENGLIEGNQTSWVSGNVAVFSCMDNFTLIGADNTTCRDDGMFDDVNVTCAVVCIAPMSPLDGAVSPVNQSQWIEGDVVSYTCNDGFRLVGRNQVTCSNRTSFEQTPSCLVICDPPIPPLNGAISPINQSQWISEDVVTYSCNAGFLLVGNENITCMNRTSFEQTPSCLVICDPPIPPLNGAILPINQSQWLSGDVVNYSCNDGFLLVGNENITCINRTSFEQTPSCLEMEGSAFIPCPEPIAPTNGRLDPANVTMWSTGDVVTFSCMMGFSLVGSSNATCLENGSFTASPPECAEMEGSAFITCLAPPTPPSGRIEPLDQTTWSVGEMVTFVCDDQFVLMGSNSATCDEEGMFRNVTVQCVATCPSPIPPQGGTVEPSDVEFFLEGASVRYTCSGNLILIGEEEGVCTRDHVFRPVRPICIDDLTSIIEPVIPPGCPQATAPTNGRVEPANQTSWDSGDVITYVCNDDFVLTSGPSNATCLDSGLFDNPAPTCTATCPPPIPPQGGAVEPSGVEFFLEGASVRYTCNGNLILIGQEEGECTRDHVFRPVRPICIDDLLSILEPEVPSGCPQPLAPSNGSFTPSDQDMLDTGDVITYQCDVNFTLVGLSNATCLESGDFDNQPPECRLSCSTPPSPEGGVIEQPEREFYFIGDEVRFRCNAGLMLIGAEVVVCSRNRIFEPPPPFCLDVSESSGEEDSSM